MCITEIELLDPVTLKIQNDHNLLIMWGNSTLGCSWILAHVEAA